MNAAAATAMGKPARPPQVRTRGAASGNAVTGLLPAPPAQQDDGDRLHHDLEILEQALAPDILQVEMDLLLHVVEAGVIVVIDLGEAGDAGLGPLAEWVVGDVGAELREDRRPLG